MPSTLLYPLNRVFITQGFGRNPSMYKKYGMKGHNGIDGRTRFSTTPQAHCHVRSMAPGIVTEVTDQKNKGYGLFVRVKHADGSESVYAHLWKAFVKVGQAVTRLSRAEGTIMGLTGNSGDSTGPHIHIGYRPPNWRELYGNGFKGYIDFLPQLSI